MSNSKNEGAREYIVAFRTANGSKAEYYGEDIMSGGYPFLADTPTAAKLLTFAAATKIAEKAWADANNYLNLAWAEQAVVCQVLYAEKLTIDKDRAMDALRDRLVAETQAEIAELQKKMTALIHCDPNDLSKY